MVGSECWQDAKLPRLDAAVVLPGPQLLPPWPSGSGASVGHPTAPAGVCGPRSAWRGALSSRYNPRSLRALGLRRSARRRCCSDGAFASTEFSGPVGREWQVDDTETLLDLFKCALKVCSDLKRRS